jgi:hypothetical protein
MGERLALRQRQLLLTDALTDVRCSVGPMGVRMGERVAVLTRRVAFTDAGTDVRRSVAHAQPPRDTWSRS